MMTDATSELKAVRTGLWLKRIGSMLLLIVLPLSLISMSPYIIMAMAAFVITVDLVGRMFCLKGPIANSRSIRWSVAGQSTGLVILLASGVFGQGWILAGLTLAVVCQLSAARWFVSYLAELAQFIERPDLTDRITDLSRRLNLFAISLYGSSVSSVVIAIAAFLFGLMSWGIGWVISVPLGGMAIILILVVSLASYLRMLIIYREVIGSLEQAVATKAKSVD
ncbi:MAG: hypothetical protein ACK5PB_01580 [Pirellula sp.]